MGTPHFRTAWRDHEFVDAYLQSGAVSVAAKAACSQAKDLDRAGRELLKRPKVQAEPHRRLEDLAKKLQMRPEDILLLVGALPRLSRDEDSAWRVGRWTGPALKGRA